MSFLQLSFLFLTFAVPFFFCGASRRRKSKRFDAAFCRTLAALLLLMEIGGLGLKIFGEHATVAAALPMQLCDWALLVTAAALWWRSPRCFEVAYFWGLAGTIQGLVTPAIPPDLALWRQTIFFVIHSGIVAGILFLVFAMCMRPVPQSLWRVVAWSEVYLVVALMVNSFTGENYGFLSHPPPTHSLLDVVPQTHWLYVATINLVAFFAFGLLYLPWWLADIRRRRCPKPLS